MPPAPGQQRTRATRNCPELLEAIPYQSSTGAVVSVHMLPKLEEVYMPPPYWAAARYCPELLEAMPFQKALGLEVSTQAEP